MSSLSHENYKIYGELPLTIEAEKDSSLDSLCKWLEKEKDAVKSTMQKHGALRFRNFEVKSAEDFERVARTVSPELKNDYLGTSPRDAVTDYVFHASELPGYYPIPQHCEMSFCANPPKFLFFSAMQPSESDSGETPICDFRKVWRELNPEVRERFVKGGMKNVRNYAAPDAPAGDEMQLKSWDDMFQSRDKKLVEQKCKDEGFDAEWKEDGGLRLWGKQPVSRVHPETGEEVWFNHLAIFHVSSPVGEYKRICELRPSDENKGILEIAKGLEAGMREKPAEDRSMHTFYEDGSEIPEVDIEHLRDVIWKNMQINAWQKGDVLAIDNFAVSHGRLPYKNEDRKILVCWS
jgi:alpha-ketoglutarate-dependent taurine dioxygenase